MATNSTVPTIKQQLVTVLDAALSVPVTYAWPGPKTESKSVFLGNHPATQDIRLDGSSEIPTIKAGRKQRQEDYTLRVTVWSFRPDLTSDGAEACETEAFGIFGDIDDELADDPQIGLASTVVQAVTVASYSSTLFPFQSGWACELAVDLRVQARLT